MATMAMIVILCVVVVILCIFMSLLIHGCKVGTPMAGDKIRNTSANRKRNEPLSQAQLDMIPRYVQETKGQEASCDVCLELLRVGDVCRFLPSCQHRFHASCIDASLVMNPICPKCKDENPELNVAGAGSAKEWTIAVRTAS